MDVERVEMRGITRFSETVTIDLAAAVGDAELVAVIGGNGEGKTSFVEAALPGALYRELPSRGGGLHSWCTAKDSMLDVQLEHAGSRWRILHEIDAVGSRPARAHLWRDGVPLTKDGGLKEFDALIARLFPPARVVLASAFGVQTGRGSFSDLSPSGKRELFVSLLGIEHYQALSVRAGTVAAAIEAAITRESVQLPRMQERVARRRALLADLLDAEGDVVSADGEAGLARTALDLADRKIADVRAAAAAAAADVERARRQRADKRAELDDVEARQDRGRALVVAAEMEAERAASLIEDAALEHELRQQLADASGRRQVETARAAAARAALAAAEGRHAAATRRASALPLAATEAALAAIRAREPAAAEDTSALSRELAEAEGEARALASRTADVERARSRIEALRAELARVQETAALIGRVPCGGRDLLIPEQVITVAEALDAGTKSGTFLQKIGAIAEPDRAEGVNPYAGIGVGGRRVACGTCELLASATSAQARIPDAERAIVAAEETLAKLTQLCAFAAAADTKARELRAQLAVASAQREARARWALEEQRLVSQLGDAQERAAAAVAASAEVAAARAELEPLESAVQAVEVELAQLRQRLAPVDGAGEARRRALQDAAPLEAYRARLADLSTHRAQLVAQIEALPRVDEDAASRAQEALERAEREAGVDACRAELQRATAAAADARAAVAGLLGALGEVGDPEAEVARVEAEVRRLGAELASYRLLQRALGREGIQALEIDAAGPEVSEICTSLLRQVDGGRWTVELRTTRPSSDGRTMREVFDLVVYDGRRCVQLVYDALSVGERSLIGEALKLAIAVFNARRSGVSFGTLWRDEPDAGLSEVAAEAYPAILREAVRMGRFTRAIWITHRRSGWEQADRILRVEGGRVTVDG